VLNIERAEFENLVAEALDLLPPDLTALMNNVAVFVEDDPPPDDPDLLGVYDGVPLPQRDGWYAGVLPDRITIFRNPILRICSSPQDVIEEVEITVVHEIAHHFGIDDARLEELGYG
jgi:predicted Zn-dependent protease with MMP-like domain